MGIKIVSVDVIDDEFMKKMFKTIDFRKGCPVCCAISKSLTKKNCDFCKAELVFLTKEYEAKFNPMNNRLEWIWNAQKNG